MVTTRYFMVGGRDVNLCRPMVNLNRYSVLTFFKVIIDEGEYLTTPLGKVIELRPKRRELERHVYCSKALRNNFWHVRTSDDEIIKSLFTDCLNNELTKDEYEDLIKWWRENE